MLQKTPAELTAEVADIGVRYSKFNIYAFAGLPPSDLTQAFSGWLIKFERVTADGAGSKGIPWAAPVANSGILRRDMTVPCQGVGALPGNMGWWLIVHDTDALGLDANAQRFSYTVGTSGADILLDSVSITQGQTYPLQEVFIDLNPA